MKADVSSVGNVAGQSVVEMTYKLEIEGRPVPKKRPRVTENSTFTPPETVQHENKILAQWVAKHGNIELGGDLELKAEFHYPDRRTADIDNLIKCVADSLGGGGDGYYPFNDRQVKALQAKIKITDGAKTIIKVKGLK